MENNIEELTSQYEALWENDAPMEQIVEFCGQHLGEEKMLLLCDILGNSAKWGDMVYLPSFLKHLQDDDDSLLRALALYWPHTSHTYFNEAVTYSRILSMKNILSEKVRAAFWTMMQGMTWLSLNLINDIYENLAFVNKGYENMTLVDNGGIRHAILKRRKKGYDFIPKGLFFLDDKRSMPLSEKMIQALQTDSVPLFEMALTLAGKKITIGLLRAILRAHAFNILIHLLKCRTKALAIILSPQDLLICICACPSKGESEKEIKLLETLEELYLGISQRTDKLGNTPLWYCLYKRSPDDPLVLALIRHGCNPDQRNHLNLSYRICAEVQKLLI